MSLLVYGTQIFSFNEAENDVNDFISNTIGLRPEDYWVSGNKGLYIVHLRLCGGKGGFGRAMKQEGERRSRRLQSHRDNSRTSSGRRIRNIRAKKKAAQIRNYIKSLEEKRTGMKSLRDITDPVLLLEELKKDKIVVEQEAYDSVVFGLKRQNKLLEEETYKNRFLNYDFFNSFLPK